MSLFLITKINLFVIYSIYNKTRLLLLNMSDFILIFSVKYNINMVIDLLDSCFSVMKLKMV